MAGSSSFAFLLLCSVFIFPNSVQTQPTNFIFNGFNGSESKLTRKGSTIVRPSGALKLTNSSKNIIGHAFFSEPIQIQNKSSFSFSTSFVFAILTPKSGRGGHGLAFTLSPSKEFPGAEPGHYMGIFNETNDGLNSNHIVAVEFDTVNGFNRDSDEEGNHVGININSMESNVTEPAAYHNQTKEDMKLESGDPIHAWVEYDGKLLNVTIAPLKSEKKPSKPLISFAVDLAPIVDETMYVGFSAATGEKSSSHFILGWSFSTNGPAAELNVSQLPVAPPQGNDGSSSYDPQVIGLIVALSFVTVLLLGILVYFICYRRKKGKSEDLEDWELDCPHRFRYKDLHVATKGFKESEIIGVGGFGAVYKGVLPTTGTEVAVKKINRNSIQGLREFAAEIESLGRLRHKNLVNLQGWCKQKNDLLLIYDYIPYGSLHSLLYNNQRQQSFVLNWEQRFNIIKGIAAGLLYLHEEWELVVIHRDIKSSNVLIDSDMNARLGDFGLARLYDHGTDSHTTNIVGTIGYIAPELARNGKASTSSDVFAYGVLLLEIVSGRKPTGSSNFFLVDWVIEYHQKGQILDAVDPKLMNLNYAIEEVKLILLLGLLCCHPRPEVRPSMKKVMRYLNGDDHLPLVENWDSFDSRDETYPKFFQVISSDALSKSYPSSSTSTAFSHHSMSIGR